MTHFTSLCVTIQMEFILIWARFIRLCIQMRKYVRFCMVTSTHFSTNFIASISRTKSHRKIMEKITLTGSWYLNYNTHTQKSAIYLKPWNSWDCRMWDWCILSSRLCKHSPQQRHNHFRNIVIIWMKKTKKFFYWWFECAFFQWQKLSILFSISYVSLFAHSPRKNEILTVRLWKLTTYIKSKIHYLLWPNAFSIELFFAKSSKKVCS